MQADRNWKVLHKVKAKGQKELLKILLNNRKIKTRKEIEEFLNPKLEDVTAASVGIDKKQLKASVYRIRKAIKNKEQIAIFGDYDVDGICGTAILWETLNSLGAKVTPYIPHRTSEGYGLSIAGIENLKSQPRLNRGQRSNLKLIITVDNGIVANKAVELANKKGIDVIITDHHVLGKDRPKALAIVHTTKLCGAGVAYLLSEEVRKSQFACRENINDSTSDKRQATSHLELVALATVADIVPVKGANRALLKFGLEELRKTKRPGLIALLQEAGIKPETIGTYEIGHIIAPRLNAMGRLEHAMDSLRLICTTNKKRAADLALALSSTNRQRQLVTEEAILHATTYIKDNKLYNRKLLYVSHKTYLPGVIGLVAGRLVEEFFRPAIVLSLGKKYSKASARSVAGFNIVEFIRQASEFLVDVGGHPMAAGFTVETEKIPVLQKKLEQLAEALLSDSHFVRNLRIDTKLPFSMLDISIYDAIQKLAPFGMANPQPVFLTEKVTIEDMRLVGAEGKHIKLKVKSEKSKVGVDAIAFGMGEKASQFHIGSKVDIVYSVEDDSWDGNRRLQLKIKDLKKN
ncbi:MAG: single-stranded-DNA-specific exonuclease RecJ [Candidatus Levybacteria bacterium]|nr:single-stranded-DNA-specific exonuclease RecJ [Candidatus Levybacteria bacterium]